MTKADWIWMPHPGHFIAAGKCQFRLNTCVGDYIVSTVGEWFPGNTNKPEEVGAGRMYETMVFAAKPQSTACCPFGAASFNELDMDGYMTAEDAFHGHMEACEKWSRREPSGG